MRVAMGLLAFLLIEYFVVWLVHGYLKSKQDDIQYYRQKSITGDNDD